MKKKAGTAVVVLYSHPELYPPTLNAIGCLAEVYEKVYVLYKPHKTDEWAWPENVRLRPVGRIVSSRAFMQSSFRKRMTAHLRFLLRFLSLCLSVRPDLLLLYDPYPALFYRIIKPFLFLRKPFLWYHNHDVIEKADIEGGNSMSRRLAEAEQKLLTEVDLFTLPALERKAYFDLTRMKGRYVTLPNFPSKKVFSSKPHREITTAVNIGFQGSVCPGRGLEGLVAQLPMSIENHPVHFSITGFCNDLSYKESLDKTIGSLKESGTVAFNGAVPYRQLKEIMNSVNIGWVYYGMDSSMDHSMGTASNKFFECCAMGLPVLYNGNNSFDVYKKFSWAIPVKLTREDISDKLTYITKNYRSLSTMAYEQFTQELNFEYGFRDVLKLLPGVHEA